MAHVDASPSHASRSPNQLIKRAPVVYGRQLNRFSSPPAVVPIKDRQQSSEYRHASAEPTQQRQSSSSLSDSVRACSPDATRSFQFDFRHRLRELDEEFDGRDVQSPGPGLSLCREAVHAGPPLVISPQSVSMGTTVLSSEARCSSGDLSPASSSPSPSSFHATLSRERPLESPVRRRTRRVPDPIPSDPEAGVQSNSSSVSPIRHAITTPHSRLSPTPPTSSEIPMASRNTKGKATARDVLPLVFGDERPLAAELPTKSGKRRRGDSLIRPRTRAPTKKERQEVMFESSRIVANRPVEVIRTQEHKHSLSAFFSGLRRDNIAAPASGAELPSDPIEKFSSPTDNPTRVPPPDSMFGAPTELLGTSVRIGTSNRPSSSKSTRALPPAASNSNDEIPSVVYGRQHRVREIKRVALQHAETSEALGINSEDDDLLIVKDEMHAVAREEAAQRRLDKIHGSPVKDMVTLRRINHPSARPAVVSPRMHLKQELQELAKPSFARTRKGRKGQLSKEQLDRLMITQHTKEQLMSIRRHEEEWIKRGGKLARDTGGGSPQTSLSQKLEVYAELGLSAVDTGEVGDEVSADENDGDYAPSARDSASPEPMDADEGSGGQTDRMEISAPRSQADDEDVAPLRRKKSGQRHPRVVVDSDDEEEQPVRRSLPSIQRDSTSSVESQTEDEDDKENSAELMYDHSEDKENKVVVRHELSSSEGAFGSTLGSVHITDGSVRGSLSLTLAEDSNRTTSSPRADVRSPLKEISKDGDDDLFLSSPYVNSPFTEGLLRSIATSPTHPSTLTPSLESPPVLQSEHIDRVNRPLGSENDKNEPSTSGPMPLQPSFLERLQGKVSPEPSSAAVNPLPNSGFSQLFSTEDRSSTRPVEGAGNDGLSLTLDVRLKPALEVSGTLKQKAETIFEKEQEYVVAAAVQNDKSKELLYVNDHGFLTQTRPEGSSPQVYCMTPSQAFKLIGTQVHLTQTQPPSARPPLRTLSLTISQELSPEPQPLRRLRRRSLSPLEHKFLGRNSDLVGKLNAFDVLSKVAKLASKVRKEEPGKSEFVAVEAEESDEDDTFGFGGPKEDEGEDDNEQDKIVEGLVDDTVMDAQTEAADLVLEKHRAYEEEDDHRLQKLHQDAIEGKFRMKRRDRGIGIEDDSDDGDNDDARVRQRIYKKRKVEGDSLEALGKNEETRAFYNTYHQDLIDEDNELEHLQDVAMAANDEDAQAVEQDEQETVSVDEIQQRVREMAQNDPEVDVLDPEDTSWIDRSMMNEANDTVRVKVMGFDVEPPKQAEDEQERKQLASWARNQSYWNQGTGRLGNSTAVTGHARVKAGGGSLRSAQPPNVREMGKPGKTKASSLLNKVSNRRDRFV